MTEMGRSVLSDARLDRCEPSSDQIFLFVLAVASAVPANILLVTADGRVAGTWLVLDSAGFLSLELCISCAALEDRADTRFPRNYRRRLARALTVFIAGNQTCSALSA